MCNPIRVNIFLIISLAGKIYSLLILWGFGVCYYRPDWIFCWCLKLMASRMHKEYHMKTLNLKFSFLPTLNLKSSGKLNFMHVSIKRQLCPFLLIHHETSLCLTIGYFIKSKYVYISVGLEAAYLSKLSVSVK